MFLAPFTAAILTAKHCDFRQSHHQWIPQQNGIINGEDDDTNSGEANYTGRVTSVTDIITDIYESKETETN